MRRNDFSYYEFGLLAFNQQESERANLRLYRALDMTKCPKCQVSKARDVLLNHTAVVRNAVEGAQEEPIDCAEC